MLVYNAISFFNYEVKSLKATSTHARDVKVATTLGGAFKTFQSELRRQAWPSFEQADIELVEFDSSPLIASLLSATAITSYKSDAQWESKNEGKIVIWTADVDFANHALGLPSFTGLSAIAKCEANTATIATAVAAFDAINPGVTATKALLLGNSDGGPYVQSWPHSTRYSISLNASGQLVIAMPPTAKPIVFVGPTSCNSIF